MWGLSYHAWSWRLSLNNHMQCYICCVNLPQRSGERRDFETEDGQAQYATIRHPVTYSIIKPVRILATTRAPERWGVLLGVLFSRSNQRCLHFTKTPDLVLTFPSPGAESSRTTVLAQREKRSLSLSIEVSKPDTCGGFNSSAHPWGFPCSAKSQKKMKRPQVSKTAGAVNSLTLSRDKEDSLVRGPLCPKPIRHLRTQCQKKLKCLQKRGDTKLKRLSYLLGFWGFLPREKAVL